MRDAFGYIGFTSVAVAGYLVTDADVLLPIALVVVAASSVVLARHAPGRAAVAGGVLVAISAGLIFTGLDLAALQPSGPQADGFRIVLIAAIVIVCVVGVLAGSLSRVWTATKLR